MAAERVARLRTHTYPEAAEFTIACGGVSATHLLQDLDEVLHDVAPPLVDDHRHRQIPQQVLAGRLHRVQVPAAAGHTGKMN